MRRDECAATSAIATLFPSSLASHWKLTTATGMEPFTGSSVPIHVVGDDTIASRLRGNDLLPGPLQTTLFRDDEVIRRPGRGNSPVRG